MASDVERCWRCHRANPYETDWYMDLCEGCLHGMVDWSLAVGDAWWLRRLGPVYALGEWVLRWVRRRQIARGVY